MRYSATMAATTMTTRDATKIATSPASRRNSSASVRMPERHRWESGTAAVAVSVGLDIWGSLRVRDRCSDAPMVMAWVGPGDGPRGVAGSLLWVLDGRNG